jgi:subfamily B ATP-binding cassette protein MsbA
MNLLKDLKIIWIYLRKCKKQVIVTSLLALSYAIFNGFIPYLYGRLVDMVFVESFSFLVLALIGIWALTSFFSSITKWASSVGGEFIAVDALSDIIYEHTAHVLDLPLSFHREKRVGEIISRITRAGDSLRDLISNTLFWIVPHFLTLFIGLIILFIINWQLSVGVIVLFVLSIGVTILRSSSLVKNQKELNKKFDKASGDLSDSFLNIQTIKSSGAEKFQREKIFRAYREDIRPVYRRTTLGWETTSLLQEGIFSLGFVGLFTYALFLMNKGIITSGDLIMFLGYLNLTKMPVMMLLWQWISIQRGMAAIKRVREFLDIKSEEYDKKGKVLIDVKAKVEFKNISFKYPKKGLLLDDISFTVKSGEKVALVGGSGGGKTTIADLLSLYFEPIEGRILIDDVNIKDLDLSFLRSIIAYVPQEIVLFNDTIKNNILYGNPLASKQEIFEAARIANADDFINNLPKKYNTLVGERGIKLSTGQKQRLAIARAVIRNPKILILDEATSSLDVKSEKIIQKAIEELTENRTTFIIAHRLSTVRKADKILVLEKGKIVEQGNHDKLMKKKGLYYKFYTLQFSEDLDF